MQKKLVQFLLVLIAFCCLFVSCDLDKFPDEMQITLNYDENLMTVYRGGIYGDEIIYPGTKLSGSDSFAVVCNLEDNQTIDKILYNKKDVTKSIYFNVRENYPDYSDEDDFMNQISFSLCWDEGLYHMCENGELKDKDTLTISLSTRPKEQVTLNFNENILFNDAINYDNISSGSSLEEGTVLSFHHIGMMIEYDSTTVLDYFLLNGQKVTEGEMTSKIQNYYYVHKRDAKNGVLDIQAITRAAKEIKINFDATKIECLRNIYYEKNEYGTQELKETISLSSGESVLETSDIYFITKLPENETAEYWTSTLLDWEDTSDQYVPYFHGAISEGFTGSEITVGIKTKILKEFLLNFRPNPDIEGSLILCYKYNPKTGDYDIPLSAGSKIYEGNEIEFRLTDDAYESLYSKDLFLGWQFNEDETSLFEDYMFRKKISADMNFGGMAIINVIAHFIEVEKYTINFEDAYLNIFYRDTDDSLVYIEPEAEISGDIELFITREDIRFPYGKKFDGVYLLNNKEFRDEEGYMKGSIRPLDYIDYATEDNVIYIDAKMRDKTTFAVTFDENIICETSFDGGYTSEAITSGTELIEDSSISLKLSESLDTTGKYVVWIINSEEWQREIGDSFFYTVNGNTSISYELRDFPSYTVTFDDSMITCYYQDDSWNEVTVNTGDTITFTTPNGSTELIFRLVDESLAWSGYWYFNGENSYSQTLECSWYLEEDIRVEYIVE